MRTGAAALIGVLLAACSGGGNLTQGNAQTPALKAWAEFPVNASPRPIVLIGGTANGPSGFATEDEKLAFMAGAIDRPPHLPTGPATAEGYPIISADRAWELLRTQGSKISASPGGTRLTITDVRLGKSTFETDRADLTMPAWLFTIAGADGQVAVLAVAQEAQWFPSGLAPGRAGEQYWAGAAVGSDHRTLTVSLIGAQESGPCGARYEVRLTESATAVMVTRIEHPNQSAPAINGTSVACDLVGHLRKASPAVLNAPLGARVLIDDLGYPIGVSGNP